MFSHFRWDAEECDGFMGGGQFWVFVGFGNGHNFAVFLDVGYCVITVSVVCYV